MAVYARSYDLCFWPQSNALNNVLVTVDSSQGRFTGLAMFPDSDPTIQFRQCLAPFECLSFGNKCRNIHFQNNSPNDDVMTIDTVVNIRMGVNLLAGTNSKIVYLSRCI